MDLKLTTATGTVGDSTLQVSDGNFARDFSEALVHQVVTAYLAGARSGTRGTKSRSAVSGGGAKPWRQKGTGRARAGTIRSPLWRAGGHTFALRPQDHSQKINKKMYRGALRAILSELLRQDRLLVVESFGCETAKTKALAEKLGAMGFTSGLIVSDADDANLHLAARNIPHIEVRCATEIDPVVLVGSDKVLMTAGAVKQIEEMLA